MGIKLKGPEIMSNTKMNRNFFLAVVAVFLAVSLFGGIGGMSAQAGAIPASNSAAASGKTSASAQKSNTSTSASEKKRRKT